MLYFVYFMSNRKYGSIYTGVTNNLVSRVNDHRSKTIEGFTKRYNCTKLIYYEPHDSIQEAIRREKNIKAWQRGWKIELIEKENPEWMDLYEQILK